MASLAGSSDLAAIWRDAFLATLQQHETAASLKEAALAGRLKDWTRLLTAVVVQACRGLRWCAAAKGFTLEMLPQAGQEYLGMDVMAFQQDQTSKHGCWRFPVAVFELENSRDDDRVAYSLWKVLCLRCRLRVVFAYRDDWDKARNLARRLSADVIASISVGHRDDLAGQCLVVIGSRGEGETFPWGYFKLWKLDANTSVGS